jgi:hypothetical protein
MTQQPSPGRIVMASADPATNNGSDVAPAMIVAVWAGGRVNLRVMEDGAGPPPWLTSATLYDTPEAFRAAQARRNQAFPDLAGQPFTGAYWPPRV